MRPSNSVAKFIFFKSAISNVVPLPEDGISIVAPPDCTRLVTGLSSELPTVETRAEHHSLLPMTKWQPCQWSLTEPRIRVVIVIHFLSCLLLCGKLLYTSGRLTEQQQA